jgi:hypothetical protein
MNEQQNRLPRPQVIVGEDLAVPLPLHWRVKSNDSQRGVLVEVDSEQGELVSLMAEHNLSPLDFEICQALLTPLENRDYKQLQLWLLHE